MCSSDKALQLLTTVTCQVNFIVGKNSSKLVSVLDQFNSNKVKYHELKSKKDSTQTWKVYVNTPVSLAVALKLREMFGTKHTTIIIS